jgi:RHS repeat-associated protein
MADFTLTLTRFPVSVGSPLAATTFVYASDMAFSIDRLRPGLPAGAFGTYEFEYNTIPVNVSAPVDNFQTVKWQLIWTNATTWLMNVWNGTSWEAAVGFGSLVPTAGWIFTVGHPIRDICFNYSQAFGLDALKEDYPTTYKFTELVTKTGTGVIENNSSSHVFDVRLLASANVAVSNTVFNPVDFNRVLTISGNWVALPAANSLYPSTIPGQTNWQPTSANILSTIKVQANSYSGTVVSNVPVNVPVTAPNADGHVGTFSLKWDGLLSGLPILGDFVYQLLADTGAGNTVPGGATSNNFPWPDLGITRTCRCPGMEGLTSVPMDFDPVSNPYAMDLSPSLTYSSMYAGDPPASFGYGWKSIQNVTVATNVAGDLLYQDETGNFQRWTFTGPNTYTAFTKDNYILATRDIPNSKYILTFKDQTQRIFSTVTGKLLQTIDRNGNTLTYSYNGSGHITQVVDSTPAARTLFYTYGTRTDGQPISVRANNPTTGNQTQFFYYGPTDPVAPNRLAQIVDAAGDITEFHYYPFGPIQYIVDSTGLIAQQFSYDSIGRKVFEQIYNDLFITYDYNYDVFTNTVTNATTTSIQDLTGASPDRITVVYSDLNLNPVTVKELVDFAASPIAINTTTTVFNDTVSLNPYLPTQVTAPNLTVTNMTYNVNGNLATTTDAQSNVTTYTYCEDIGDPNPKHRNLLARLLRPTVTVAGVPTVYTNELWAYDTNGNLLTYTDALSHNTGYTYNGDGTVATTTDTNSHVTSFGYYATSKNLQTITLPKHPYDPVGASQRITTLAYDSYDNLTSTTDALSHATTMLYDANDRLTQVTDALGKFTTMTYVQGLLTQTEYPSNQGSGVTRRKTQYFYDNSNRLQVINRELFSGGFQTRILYGYTGHSQMNSLQRMQTNGRINETSSSYDVQGRILATQDPLGRTTRTKHAAYCNNYEVSTARGVTAKYTMDTLCRLTQVASQTEIRSFAYDQLSRLVSDGNGGRYGWNQDPSTVVGAREGESVYSNGRTYLYDPLDRVTTVSFQDTNGTVPTNIYVYDNVGNVLSMTDPNGTITTYTYYDDNSLATVTLGGGVFTYVYDLAGRLSTLTYPPASGIVATFGWDNKNRLLSLQYKKGVPNFQSFVYTYDDSDNRITLVDTTGVAAPINWSFTYDWLNRLLSATRNGVTTSYAYDTSDNRTTTTTGATVYNDSHDAGDQLTTRKLGAALFESYQYDRDGNMTSRTLASSSAVTAYKWNDFGKLIGFALNGVFQESDFYDADGIRRIRNDGTKFYNSGSLVVSETRPTGPVSFIQGHQLLGLRQGANNFYMISDGLGSVRQVVTNAGVSSATFEPDAYGNAQVASTGSADLLANTYTGSLGVRNELSARGLYYARERWYDSSLGRWLSPDPIGFQGGLNYYGFVNANPINGVDPSGLKLVITSDPGSSARDGLIDYLNQRSGLNLSKDNGLITASGTGAGPNKAIAILLQKLIDDDSEVYEIRARNLSIKTCVGGFGGEGLQQIDYGDIMKVARVNQGFADGLLGHELTELWRGTKFTSRARNRTEADKRFVDILHPRGLQFERSQGYLRMSETAQTINKGMNRYRGFNFYYDNKDGDYIFRFEDTVTPRR